MGDVQARLDAPSCRNFIYLLFISKIKSCFLLITNLKDFEGNLVQLMFKKIVNFVQYR